MVYMSIASNVYASKAYSEHPIASWTLDDDVSYISLMTEAQRSFDLWTLTNATYVDYLPYPDNPFPNGPFPYSTFSELTATDPNIVMEAISPNLFNLQDLSQDMNTFAINLYLYSEGSVQSYEYGYRYLDPFTGSYIEETKTTGEVNSSSWVRLGSTFNPPNINANAQVVLRVTFSGSASPSVVMNGLSIGQWSEQTNGKSLGATTELVNIELQNLIGNLYGVPIEAYGVSNKDGYIITNDNMLLATNVGVPMVFGSDNVTRLRSNYQNLTVSPPAVVVPGCGFLNESGKYNSYTFEMWMRIENNQVEDRRIWGPLGSDYGLYISRGYLTLLIGDSFQSYFVADWYRPMLVHVTLRENAASVLINGEEVISLTFDTASLSLPAIDEDWIGFYCYFDMPLYEIDCVSVFPYIIPAAVAKKRFVWGQGVESPENINSAYEGTVSYVDYPYAQYTANKVYPDLQYWDAGYFENLVATKRSISLPNYALPEIAMEPYSINEWYADNRETNNLSYSEVHSKFITLRPNNNYISSAIIQDSPLSYFRMNDTAGTTAANSISGASVGTYVESPTLANGQMANDGSSVRFNGTSQYVTALGQTNINSVITSSVTIEGWFNCEDISKLTPQTIYEEGGQINGAAVYVYDGKIYGIMWASSVIRKQISYSIESNKNYHFAFVFSSNPNICKLYVNGYSVSSPTTNSATDLPVHTAANGIAGVNSDSRTHLAAVAGTGVNLFQGSISNIARYNKVLDDRSIYGRYSGWFQSYGTKYELPSYLLFPSMNILTDVVRGVWGVFEINTEISESQPLMVLQQIQNPLTRIEITVLGNDIYYRLYQNDVLHPIEFTFPVTLGEHFVIGFHLPRLLDTYGNIIGEFFGNPSNIQVYVGGNGTDTFEGKIYRVGFSNQTNLNEIETHFGQDGIALPDDGELLDDHLGSYTLIPLIKFNRMFLDIGVSSYWEEYFPMSMFAGYKTDQYGKTQYDVDFLQYNIGYPTTSTISYDSVTGSWSYEELREEYFSPVVRTYEALDNSLITGYDSYNDLQNNSITSSSYDFSSSSVRTYITFQRVSQGANTPLSEYSILQSVPETGVIDVNQYSNQFSTKFEIKDNTIIYPPSSVNVNNLAAVVHLDINVNGIKSNPLSIRKMSLSSKTLDTSTFSEIGTRFGTKLYPYSKVGMYFDNKKQNPYAITKESVPYLYLTKNSGIESLGLREFNIERGISIPINSEQVQDQKVSAMQLWLRYSDDQFPFIPSTLFALDGKNIDIGFNIVSDSSTQRGMVTAVDLATGLDYTNLTFFQDGVQVLTPYIEKNKWTVIGISFSQPIDFSNYVGSLNLFQSAVFNSIAYYKSGNLQEIQSVVYRKWENVDGTTLSPLDWQYWKVYESPFGKWDNVLKIAETGIYGVSPEDIYKSYNGTNREIVDDNEGLIVSQNGTLVFASEILDVVDTTPTTTTRILVTNEPEWSSYIKKPV